MSTPASPDAATEARVLGNDLYRAGKLPDAEKEYKKAARLAPHDASPVSNLSAVRYEMGDYQGAIFYARKAISLTSVEVDDTGKKNKLYSRLAKCYLHRLDFGSAEEAISAMGHGALRSELCESVESTKVLWAAVPDESVLRRQVLDQIPLYKAPLQDVPEYYCVGHDKVEPLNDPFGGLRSTGRPDISFLFAGSGDGRNVLSAMLSMACRQVQTSLPPFGNLHITVVDLKAASMARLLILFNMMAQVEANITEDTPHTKDYFLAMAYLFSCQVIPPFVEAKLQSSIKELITRLEGPDAATPFAYVREHDREPLIRVLRQWQRPWDGFSNTAHLRRHIQQKHAEDAFHKERLYGKNWQIHGSKTDRADFDKLTTLLPPAVAAKRREPSLVAPLAEYRSMGQSKKLLQHIDASWKINNTLLDYAFTDRNLAHGGESPPGLEFYPLEVVDSLATMNGNKASNISAIEKLAGAFRAFTSAVFTFVQQDRLVVEVIVGEVADIMERMRYNLLDHRLLRPTDGGKLDPSAFPRTFDYIHLSNIPDYIGGHLTTFLAGRPLLKEDQPSNIRFNNLLNPPEFMDHEEFLSEYLLMYDMRRISRHFLVSRREGPISIGGMAPMDDFMRNTIAENGYMICEGDMTWDRVSRSAMSFQQLMPKREFEKWMYAHFLKICLPYPRPMGNGRPVYAPLNLTSVIRLAVAMFEVGYPAHWLLKILSSICTGVITASARPPSQRVSKPPVINASHPAKSISVHPWVAEFTTLLSIWRRLLPFGTDSLSGMLVPLQTICQYTVKFPSFRTEYEHVPQFFLLFWDTKAGCSAAPPASMYSLLGGQGGDSHMFTQDVREKAIVCVSAVRYTTATRTAEFWMRADKMEQMMAGKWRVFMWRTDAWKAVTSGVDVAGGVVAGKKWM